MELKEILSQREQQISTLLLRELRDVQINGNYPATVSVLNLIKTINSVGWIEHTCDWDLNAIITLNNGETHETGHGYGDCLEITLKGKRIGDQNLPLAHEIDPLYLHLTLPNDWPDDEDLIPFTIPINEIHSITIDY